MNTDSFYKIFDILMSEYHWTLEYCLSLPSDVVSKLLKEIQIRKLKHTKLWTKLIGCAVGAGFNGKINTLDKLFSNEEASNPELDKLAWKAQMKGLWKRLGKDPDEFEKKWDSGENISF